MYIQRQQVEIDSGIYEPLPPVNSTRGTSIETPLDSTYSLVSLPPWPWSSSEESVGSLSDSEAEDFSRDFNDRLEDYGRELWFLKLAMVILMALILGLFSGVLWIIFTLNGYGTR